jgi:hypothetical protein
MNADQPPLPVTNVRTCSVRRGPLRAWLGSMLLLGVCLALVYALWGCVRLHAQEQAVIANVHALQLAAEKYAVNDPLIGWPLSVEQMLASGCLSAVPINPYTGEPARNIGAGMAATAGDFSYLPLITDIVPGFPLAIEYEIVGYGRKARIPRPSGYDARPNIAFVDWSKVTVWVSNSNGFPPDQYLRQQALNKMLGRPDDYAEEQANP